MSEIVSFIITTTYHSILFYSEKSLQKQGTNEPL